MQLTLLFITKLRVNIIFTRAVFLNWTDTFCFCVNVASENINGGQHSTSLWVFNDFNEQSLTWHENLLSIFGILVNLSTDSVSVERILCNSFFSKQKEMRELTGIFFFEQSKQQETWLFVPHSFLLLFRRDNRDIRALSMCGFSFLGDLMHNLLLWKFQFLASTVWSKLHK